MNSLTYKLAGIFLAMSLVPLIVGGTGAAVLQTAESTLTENNRTLKGLSGLISSAGESLTESARLQAGANAVTEQIARVQESTAAALKDMGDTMFPRAFAIARMRLALADATAAERALLLALNMRHLDPQELKATRDAQMGNLETAMNSLETARGLFITLIREGEARTGWDAFEESLAAWRANHGEFMAEIANLETLVEDMVRGGPLFASASRRAYDTAFVSGKNVREACERDIEVLSQEVVRTAETNIMNAMSSEARTRALVGDLGRESEAAIGKAGDLRAQIESAGRAADRATGLAAEALAGTSSRFWHLMVFSILGVAVAAGLGMALSLRISRPIRKMATHMSLLARGDLSDDVPASDRARKDEIGQLAGAMQDMIHSTRAEIRMANALADGDYTRPMPLRSEFDQLGRALGAMLTISNETLSRVSRAVDRVGTGASAVSQASRALSQGAETSAAALEEISRTVGHVDRQAKDNAVKAREANGLATTSRDAAQRGYNAVTELVSAMSEIQQAGKRIALVAKLIDDIAFQTNLLALNAAVEAARAGRQGKGFSVVADEVRNLSGRSAKAARETGEMVAAMTAQMEAGAQLAARSDREFREIVEATERVAQIFEGISDSSNAQSVAMAQIASGIGQIDAVTQENTVNAGQTASSAQTLSGQAEELRRMVSRFKLLSRREKPFEDGYAGARPQSATPPSNRAAERRLLLSAPEGEENGGPETEQPL